MKKLSFLSAAGIFLLVLVQAALAQYSLTWQNSEPNHKYPGTLTSDNQGNIISTGGFTNSITLGSTTLTQAAYSTSYMAKMNASGSWAWAKKIAITAPNAKGVGTATITDAAVDNSGNVYLTGTFNGTISLDNISLKESFDTKRKNDPYYFWTSDIFVAKLNNAGIVLWAKREGGYEREEAYGIATDVSGNCIVYRQDATTSDMSVTKYNGSGTKQWEQKFSGEQDPNSPHDVAVDAANNIYITGSLLGNGNFSTGYPYSVTGYPKAFLAKLNSGGSVQWLRIAGGQASIGSALLVDNTNNVYLAGTYAFAGATFDNLSLPAPTTTYGPNMSNTFLVKYSSSGNAIWAIQAVSTDQSIPRGSIAHTFLYPGGDIGLHTLAQNGAHIKHFDPSTGAEMGAVLSTGFTWADNDAGLSSMHLGGITPTQDGYAFSLSAVGSIGFGNLTLVSSQTNINNPEDVFLVKFTASSANAGTVSGPSSLCAGQTANYTSDGDAGGSWGSSNTSVATVNGTGDVTALSAGTTNIVYMVGGAVASKTLTVNTSPDAGTVSGASSICAGATTAFTSNGTPGGTWSSDNASVATVSPGGVITGVGAGTTNIIYTVTNSCGSSVASKAITIANTPPSITCPANITNTQNGPTKCSVSLSTPNPNISNNCVVSKLTWVMSGAVNSSSPATGINYVGTQTFPVGVTTITYTLTNGAGSSTSCSFTVTVVNSKCAAARESFSEVRELELVKSGITIYPNPASSHIIVSVANSLGTVRMYDMTRRLYYQQFFSESKAWIDIQKLEPGTYYVTAEGAKSPARFVKQ